MTWQPTHIDLSSDKKVRIMPCPYVSLKGLIRVQSSYDDDDLYWARLSDLKPICPDTLPDPSASYRVTVIPAPDESPQTAALKAILEITGKTQPRAYTALSQIDNLARKGLTSGT